MNIISEFERAAMNVKDEGYSVDHLRGEAGTLAIRNGTCGWGYDLVWSDAASEGPNKEWEGLNFEEAVRLAIKLLQPAPKPSQPKRPSREKRLHGEYAKLETQWLLAKTPPKKASIPLGKGWSIALRRDEVFPDDPGNGTPAMVCGPFGASSTLGVASDMGVVDNRDGEEITIPQHVLDRLHIAEDYANSYIEIVTEWIRKEGIVR